MPTPGDIREELLVSNTEYQRLSQEHSKYAARLEEIVKSPFLSSEDLLQEIQLKKLKLQMKDRMERIVAEASARRISRADVMAAASR